MHTLHARDASPADYGDFLRAYSELGVEEAPSERERWIRAYMPTTQFFMIDGADDDATCPRVTLPSMLHFQSSMCARVRKRRLDFLRLVWISWRCTCAEFRRHPPDDLRT